MAKVKWSKKKKVIAYCIAFVAQIAVLQLISVITGVSTANTWLGAIGATAIFATVIKILLDIKKSIKNTHNRTTAIIEIIIFFFVAAVIIANVAFFVELLL